MRAVSFVGGEWLNAPALSSVTDEELLLATDAKTDFWRDTFYGFTRETGHALLFNQEGDFTAEIRVIGEYQALYDQAGLMVRIDDQTWMKTGVEVTDGKLRLSTVVTNGRSDWSVATVDADLRDIRLRVTCQNKCLRVQVSLDGLIWPLLRLAPFPGIRYYRVGPMAATPEGPGFRATFSQFRCGLPLVKDLHDWS